MWPFFKIKKVSKPEIILGSWYQKTYNPGSCFKITGISGSLTDEKIFTILDWNNWKEFTVYENNFRDLYELIQAF